MKVALLAGGLGGSRFARALTETLDPQDVTVVGNVGDDLEVSGLHVSPDLDTILYTLAGVLDEDKGWGRAGETWHAREAADELGAETWFQLGDRDLGLHLVRTEALHRGEPLSAVTARLARAFGVPFVEGDDFHDPENIARMARGEPLTDEMRRPWLDRLNGELHRRQATGVVLACSALTEASRRRLTAGLDDVRFVVLTGDRELLRERLARRTSHFFDPLHNVTEEGIGN